MLALAKAAVLCAFACGKELLGCAPKLQNGARPMKYPGPHSVGRPDTLAPHGHVRIPRMLCILTRSCKIQAGSRMQDHVAAIGKGGQLRP